MRLNRRVPVGTHGGVRGRSLVKRASYAILLGKKTNRTLHSNAYSGYLFHTETNSGTEQI
mgnify:CR=1 FL=1